MLFYEKMINKVNALFGKTSQVPEPLRSQINAGYPTNHLYDIQDSKLIPYARLASRYKKLRSLYLQPLTSFLDLSCCKGYFVFEASQESTCTRSLGIDIFQPDLETCAAVKEYLRDNKSQFANLKLRELADQIGQFGGPFQTAMLINTYQYLFFGSEREPEAILDHDKIFHDIRRVCTHRFIFNNRTELEHCQNTNEVAKAGAVAKTYNTQDILAAAQKYFNLVYSGVLGRYPLWVFEAK